MNAAPFFFVRRWVTALILLAQVPTAGCSSWNELSSEPLELPAARMSNESVALQITFVRVPTGKTDINSTLWQYIDEQLIDPEQRSHLNNNGFRCGIVGSQLPTVLRELLDEKESQSTLEAATPREIDSLAMNRRINSKSGKRSEIVTSAPEDEMIVLYKDQAGTKVTGKSFDQAQAILACRTFPQGDGATQIELMPEIHHGQPRKQWIAGEGTFHLMAGRDRELFSDLVMRTALFPGQTLIISSTPESRGLGHNFFVDISHGDPQQKLLLIRLAQTQRDDLFEADGS